MQGTRPIPVVVASARSADLDNLRELLAGAPWDLIGALDREKAVEALHRALLPIVLCDENLDGQPWQETMRTLLRTRRRACVILLCDEGDRQKCEDVVKCRGFDLLTRPIDRDQLFATLVCAYSRCRMSGFWLASVLPSPLSETGKKYQRRAVHRERDDLEASRLPRRIMDREANSAAAREP